MSCYERLLQIREKIALKNPQDQQLAVKLMQLYTYQNEYQKMSSKATQLEKLLGNPDYGLYSIEALYLNSQVKGASPFLINLAIGFLEKQRQQRASSGQPLPLYFVQLYTKIMLSKGEYDKVLDFLSQNEASFAMTLDKQKLIFKTLLRKGDKLGALNELLSIVRHNFENVNGDF